MAFVLAPATAQDDKAFAEIEVEFHGDDMGFDVNSSKDLSTIIIEYCPGNTEKIEFEDGTNETTIERDRLIVGVWVKSGAAKDEDGPPGAGERFDNDVECPEENGEEEDPCPATLSAEAHQDGSITVTTDGLEGNGTLMRAAGDADAEEVATLSPEEPVYNDTDTEVGVTYTYTLFVDEEQCDLVEVTAIPVFPGVVAAVAAMGLSLLGYVGLRRR